MYPPISEIHIDRDCIATILDMYMAELHERIDTGHKLFIASVYSGAYTGPYSIA